MKKVLIVTGSSRGIGAATALKAATQGYAVCVNYLHNDAAANQIVSQIQKNGGSAGEYVDYAASKGAIDTAGGR